MGFHGSGSREPKLSGEDTRMTFRRKLYLWKESYFLVDRYNIGRFPVGFLPRDIYAPL